MFDRCVAVVHADPNYTTLPLEKISAGCSTAVTFSNPDPRVIVGSDWFGFGNTMEQGYRDVLTGNQYRRINDYTVDPTAVSCTCSALVPDFI